MNNIITFILGSIIFIAIDLLLEKAVFNTEFFNETVRQHKNFQLLFRVFLILLLLLTELTAWILRDSFHKPEIAWITRGIFVGLFFRLAKYKEKL